MKKLEGLGYDRCTAAYRDKFHIVLDTPTHILRPIYRVQNYDCPPPTQKIWAMSVQNMWYEGKSKSKTMFLPPKY